MKDSDRRQLAKVAELIRRGIAGIDQLLAGCNLPAHGRITEEQLRFIRQELIEMLSDLAAQRFAEAAESGIRFGRLIVDSWPLESELGDLLLRAENQFLAICRRLAKQ
ncbi:hypothetical protein EG19_12015 [Thermoanaerobaculum aquaticum]|jgi:hypothetical protein|uniref:Uncharacterized protein n=1 Tax=Thermoanaerobaculum aquaticum TaxID=1312852 RepID=A0A062XYE9_9BACT|nr:hypothetical protein [Thermoanaerobaculum aquaticum]KDA54434.1 hypothetical protein EG19_12015 [Thermoanaerobaculum aquaticum]